MLPKSCGRRSPWCRRLLGIAIVLTGTAFGASRLAAAESANHAFDIPAENAETALRTFAEQADTQFVYSADKVKGVRTNALRGNYAPREALDRLVSGTELFVVQDDRTGALTVDRNRSRAIPQNSPTPQNEANVKTYRQTHKTLLGWLAALFVATSSPSINNAQDVAPAAPPPQQTPPEETAKINDEAIMLSPFVVSTDQDNGYIASNTLAGSRLNTPLANTPLAISVLTKDFIEDIGAMKISDAIEYATGAGNDIGGGGYQVGATTGNGLIDNDYNFMIRGYRLVQTTRDFFPTILQGDAFNLERIDISRGPNSTLFGVGGAGGIVVQQDGNYAAERGLSAFDMRHQFRFQSTYELPFGERNRWANHGWKEKAFSNLRLMNNVTWHTGTPDTVYLGGSAANNSGTGSNFSERANMIANPNLGICGGSSLGFFNTAAFVTPPAGKYGDERRGAVEGPCQFSWNVSIAKSVRFGAEQRHTFNASWEIQNLTNTPVFSGVGTTLGSNTFGRITSAGSMRTMDIMIRFNL